MTNVIIDILKDLLFGAKRDEWIEADDAEKAQMLEDSGLATLTPEDVHEALTVMWEELPPEQAMLLSGPAPMAAPPAPAGTINV